MIIKIEVNLELEQLDDETNYQIKCRAVELIKDALTKADLAATISTAISIDELNRYNDE